MLTSTSFMKLSFLAILAVGSQANEERASFLRGNNKQVGDDADVVSIWVDDSAVRSS